MFYNNKNVKRNFGKEYCVYRYVENGTGRVIYVGKTNCSLRARITAHRYEKGFQEAKDFHVEYISLSNSVETDSVEKFFINKWKPYLNVKDKVFGLSRTVSSEMDNLKWIPYKEYEATFKNPVALSKTVGVANNKAEFLKTALLYGGDGHFVCPFVSGNLLLPFADGERYIVKQEVVPCFGGYKYFLKDGIYEELERNKYQIEAAIWLPVLLICPMTDEEEVGFDMINRAIEFGDELESFALSGYENDRSLYQYNFRTENPGKDVVDLYRSVFDGEVYFSENNITISADVNRFSYEDGIEEAENAVAKKALTLVYNLKMPVVSEKNFLIDDCEMVI